MPIIQVKFATPTRPAPAPQSIADTVVRLTAEVLRKRPDLTAITIDELPASHWFVAGPSLAEQGKSSFFLDIKIVDGTNTKDEKAAYVAAIFEAMAGLLGDLHAESYVYVHDVRAEAYGYGGRTQEHRYIAGRLAAAA
jgi:4-oxalocrotonate tautomerase